MKNNVFLGALLCFIASVSWGAMFPVAHGAFKYIDPFYFTIIPLWSSDGNFSCTSIYGKKENRHFD